MRIFTIRSVREVDSGSTTVHADYMTRDFSYPNTLRFWVKPRHWWNRRRMIAAIENSHGLIYATSEELPSDAEFLKDVRVKL
jgi:hypothetical protein